MSEASEATQFQKGHSKKGGRKKLPLMEVKETDPLQIMKIIMEHGEGNRFRGLAHRYRQAYIADPLKFTERYLKLQREATVKDGVLEDVKDVGTQKALEVCEAILKKINSPPGGGS